MKKILIAAAVALGATALAAEPAFAQRDHRGDHERQPDGERSGDRGQDDGGRNHRRGGDNGAPPAQAPPQPVPDQNGGRTWRGGNDGALAGGPRDGPPPGQGNPGFNGRRNGGPPPGQGNPDFNGPRNGGPPPGQGNPGFNGPRNGAGQGDGHRGPDGAGTRHDGNWNGDGRGRDGRGRGDGDGRNWDGDRHRGGGDHDGRNWNGDNGRGGNHDGRGQRDWRHDDNGRDWHDWNWRRDDRRYRPYWNSHRDFARPRYNDWRRIRHGYYFDDGYAFIVHGFFGANYRWWNYPHWRRPYRDYYVGGYLPDYIWWEPVPWDLYYRLPPAPYGCRYIMVNHDILLISLETGIILDALVYY